MAKKRDPNARRQARLDQMEARRAQQEQALMAAYGPAYLQAMAAQSAAQQAQQTKQGRKKAIKQAARQARQEARASGLKGKARRQSVRQARRSAGETFDEQQALAGEPTMGDYYPDQGGGGQAPIINVFGDFGGGGGQPQAPYPTLAAQPQDRAATDRTRVNLADRIGDLV